MRFAGIDVSAKKLSVVMKRTNGVVGEVKEFNNTPQGHTQLIKYINPKKGVSRVCLEATGIYHFDLSVRLSDTDNIEVMVANPKFVKNFGISLNQNNKTDNVDAVLLMEYAERMPYKPWKKPREEYIKLRNISRQISRLTDMRTAAKNQLHAQEASTSYEDKLIIKSQKELIKHLDKQLSKLQSYAVSFVESVPELLSRYELLQSIKGIGEISAIQLLGELMVLPADMSNKQWVKHAGLNPCQRQSGTSVNRPGRISKAGNRHLRKTLYLPALTATQHDGYVRGYYYHLTDETGIKKKQAICAVMRKMLLAIHGMFENERPFDSSRFYSKEVAKKVSDKDIKQAV